MNEYRNYWYRVIIGTQLIIVLKCWVEVSINGRTHLSTQIGCCIIDGLRSLIQYINSIVVGPILTGTMNLQGNIVQK